MITVATEQFGEFDVIDKYFSWKSVRVLNSPQISATHPIILGIGDDCALIAPPSKGNVLAITSDMLVENRHFFAHADPQLLGHKALAVNLSDLAAMGAKPLGFTLSIALPEINHDWLKGFSTGLRHLSEQFECPLIGGDTTAGPLTISITAFGEVPKECALRRDGAQVGDDIWVSGTLGDARFILGALRNEWEVPLSEFQTYAHRMHAPTARVELGIALRNIAHSAIDISDGLLGDLRHLLKASKVCAQIAIDAVNCSPLLAQQPLELKRQCTLRGGDDYEICFTAPAHHAEHITQLGRELQLPLTKIGKVLTEQESLLPTRLELIDSLGQIINATQSQSYLRSFDHFQTS